MSTETITIVISAAALLLSFFGAFGWMVHRVDEKIDSLDAKLSARITAGDEQLGARITAGDEQLSARIDGVEERLSARIDGVEERLSARIDGVAREVVEVKIAVARLEGPPRHLLTAR